MHIRQVVPSVIVVWDAAVLAAAIAVATPAWVADTAVLEPIRIETEAAAIRSIAFMSTVRTGPSGFQKMG